MPLPKEEINRKLLHLVALAIPALIFYLPGLTGASQLLPVVLLFAVLLVCFAVELSRRRNPVVKRWFATCFGTMLRQEEDEQFTGALYIVAAGVLCAIVFYSCPHVAFMCLSLFILGDALAAIVGMSVGRIRIHGKTLEGSLACLLLSLVLSFFVFPYLPLLLDAWGGHLSPPIVLTAALSTTLFELFPPGIPGKTKINDNLTVPVITGVLMIIVHGIVS